MTHVPITLYHPRCQRAGGGPFTRWPRARLTHRCAASCRPRLPRRCWTR